MNSSTKAANGIGPGVGIRTMLARRDAKAAAQQRAAERQHKAEQLRWRLDNVRL